MTNPPGVWEGGKAVVEAQEEQEEGLPKSARQAPRRPSTRQERVLNNGE